MKLVTWTDDQGYKRRSLLRDNDPDHAGPSGLPLNPPDINQIDWDEVKRELHNLLAERGLVDFNDVQKQQNGLTSSILHVLKPKLLALYRQQNGG